MMRIGIGYDVHKFAENRQLIIGGINIPFERGLLGHSDADVLCHAITDALLGSLSLGDIGSHFPDTNPAYKDISSLKLLKLVASLINQKGYKIVNIDSVVVAQEPKLKPYITKIINKLSEVLEIDSTRISVKATTTEKLGFEGRKEGISSQAVVLVSCHK